MSEKLKPFAGLIWRTVFSNLYERAGFHDWWDGIDPEIKDEIDASVSAAISRRLGRNRRADPRIEKAGEALVAFVAALDAATEQDSRAVAKATGNEAYRDLFSARKQAVEALDALEAE